MQTIILSALVALWIWKFVWITLWIWKFFQEPAFWSNVVSGILSGLVALIVGIPVGLWVNRRIIRYSDKVNDEKERRRLDGALELVLESVVRTRENLQMAIESLNSGALTLFLDLDSVTWEVVKQDIAQYLKDLRLKSLIANYFQDIETAERVYEIYLSALVGVASALTNAQTIRDSSKQTFIKLSESMINSSIQIERDINSIRHSITR